MKNSHNDNNQNNPQRLGKGNGRLENKGRSEDHAKYSIIKIGQHTGKSPGDLKRLAVTQTPMNYHQLMLVWKTLKGVENQKATQDKTMQQKPYQRNKYLDHFLSRPEKNLNKWTKDQEI